MATPLVSVCIPAFNQERYIEAAVASVLSQTMADFELIIADDCSTDGTYERLLRFSDSRMRVTRNDKNLGLEGNWNAVLKKARGTYVKVLCGDDILYPECLEKQTAILRDPENASLALVAASRITLSPAGKPIFRRAFFKKDTRIPGREAARKCLRSGTNIFGEPGAVLFRRNLLDKTGLFDGTIPYLIDLDMWVRLLQHGDALILAEPLFGFRVSDASLSCYLSNRQGKEFSKFVDKIGRDSAYSLSLWDAIRGKIMAHYMLLMRKIFYSLFINKP